MKYIREGLTFDPEKFTTYVEDMQVIEDLFGDKYTLEEICSKMDISETDYLSIKHGEIEPTKQQLENIYNFAYNKGLYLNEIKWGECVDEFQQGRVKVGSHGSRVNIKGDIRLDVSGESNDFADGFYVGQHISQAGMFVGGEPNSSLYILTFNTEGLDVAAFNVGVDWMLAVAYYRDRIPEYADHPKIKAIRDRVDNCDYVFAPIADNKIFEVIDAFTEGLITDKQCLYALSATHLGYQYVLKTQKALEHLEMKEHMYYCAVEKSMYNKEADIETNTSMNKAIIAKKRYADHGQYITELLSDVVVEEEITTTVHRRLGEYETEDVRGEPSKIRWWYDRPNRIWIIQVFDDNDFEIENEKCGHRDYIKSTVAYFKDKYGITDARKYRTGE